MKFVTFLEEKISFILFQIILIAITSGILYLTNIPFYYIVITIILLMVLVIMYLFIDYILLLKKYQKIVSLVDNLEEKYLIAEMIHQPLNLENKAYYYALKQASKSMFDKISLLEHEFLDYQEYIESFVHEIKTPIAALSLTFDNNREYTLKNEIDKINELTEQILFYARSNSTEKDYFVKEVNLEDIIHSVILKYRHCILDKKIKLNIHDLEIIIFTDEKWIVFIVSQIIQNCIKYLDKQDKNIEIFSQSNKNNIVLTIKDNGCGIKESDLTRVFEKGFTGSDRTKSKSTGMGLYLAKKIGDNLGLKIDITSEYSKGTTVKIVIPKSKYNTLD